MIDRTPRVFISYSWTSTKFQQQVKELAERLVHDGVDVVLDIWDLKDGQDKFHFMEQCVTDPQIDRVLIICDSGYVEIGDARKGGVGDETAIISPEIYGNAEQEKFIPVIMEYNQDGKPFIPAYLKGRMYNHILHIHGGLYPYCDEPPILGHGNVKKIKEYREKAERAAEEYDEGKESIYNAVANYYERTFKNTNECMAFRGNFFRQLTEVNNVEIIGHSFGEVDMPYFIYLKYCISKNAKWKFYYHSLEDYNAAEEAVKELELDIGDYEILPSDCFWQ